MTASLWTQPPIWTGSTSVRGSIAELYGRQPLLAVTGLALVLLMAPLAVGIYVDPRTLQGVSVWDKPFKFALSFSVYMLTLTYFLGWIRPEARNGRLLQTALKVGVVATVIEVTWILVQAARGVLSHFNYSTQIETALYVSMGLGAVLITAMSLVVGWEIWRRPHEALPPALRTAGALGLTVTFLLTLVTAGYLSAYGGHFVGPGTSSEEGLAFMGWARDGGDLRVPHFFATHAMHVVPLAIGFATVFWGARRSWPALLVTAIYTGFVALLFQQALAGRPFLPMLG